MTAGHVVTVEGPVEPSDLGVVLPHEHLFLYLDNWFVPPAEGEDPSYASSPVSMENLSAVRYRPFGNWDNIRIEDADVVLKEMEAFRKVGGGTIVDVTPPAIGRDPARLKALSQQAGVRVVCGSGYYVQTAHPPEVARMSVEEIAEGLIAELETGIGSTGVRPGVIGEIGTSDPITSDERKVLLASAAAQRHTGAPVSIHMSSNADYGSEVLDILAEGGAEISKVAIGHLDGRHPIDVEDHMDIAARGAYVEYDIFGMTEFSEDGLWPPPPADVERIKALGSMSEAGYARQLLVSHDICTKIQQKAFGGFGFAHLPGHVAPVMEAMGFPGWQLDSLLRENPARWLTWEPRPS